MSILIKGMAMPISCEKCPLTCEALQFFNGTGRPQSCPLIEIPTPHGRLVEEHYDGELQAKRPEGIFIIYYSADKDADRFILEAEE